MSRISLCLDALIFHPPTHLPKPNQVAIKRLLGGWIDPLSSRQDVIDLFLSPRTIEISPWKTIFTREESDPGSVGRVAVATPGRVESQAFWRLRFGEPSVQISCDTSLVLFFIRKAVEEELNARALVGFEWMGGWVGGFIGSCSKSMNEWKSALDNMGGWAERYIPCRPS